MLDRDKYPVLFAPAWYKLKHDGTMDMNLHPQVLQECYSSKEACMKRVDEINQLSLEISPKGVRCGYFIMKQKDEFKARDTNIEGHRQNTIRGIRHSNVTAKSNPTIEAANAAFPGLHKH